MIQPIRVQQESLEILDQRALPCEVTYIICREDVDVVEAIRSLAVRGAPAIGVAALYGLWLGARAAMNSEDFTQALEFSARRLKSARPTAVNLAMAIDRGLAMAQGQPRDQVVSTLRREADDLWAEEEASNRRMAKAGASLIPFGSRVLTHCNTGSLATSGMGTALGVIRQAYLERRITEVWVDETRPLLQGARLTAWELMEDGIPLRLITDSTAASLMAQGEVSLVLVGADRITRNGDVANKIGTYSLAVLAKHHEIPFYVVAPMTTCDARMATGMEIPIEEREADEVRAFGGREVAPSRVPVYNPAFDVTPHDLVTAIVTDRGVARAPYTTSLWEENADA